MPKFIIHAGPPKTASTYLQTALRAMAPALRERGVWYPELWWTQPGHSNHAELFWAINEGRAETMRDAFERLRATDADTVVLSCEGFAGMRPRHLRDLRDLIAGHETEIVYYCRRWSDLIPSQWQESIKAGKIETFPELVARIHVNPSRLPLNFGLTLDRLREEFGNAAIKLISLSNLFDAKQDMARHFCTEILGQPDLAPPKEGERVNESMTMQTAELLRCLNVTRVQRGAEPDRRNFVLLNRFRNDATVKDAVTTLGHGMNDSSGTIELDDASPILRETYDRISAANLPALLNPGEPARLFERRARQVRYIRQDFLTMPGMVEALRALETRLDALRTEPPLRPRLAGGGSIAA
jgi:hypothetical protein